MRFKSRLQSGSRQPLPKHRVDRRSNAKALIDQAAAGNIQAIKELADRLDGKPTQMIETTPAMREATAMRTATVQIVHVNLTQEEIEKRGLVVDYQEAKAINGNGHDHADGEIKTVNGNGHGRE
jgi:hypothetical protein